MKNTTMVRCKVSNLYDLASEMFGFVMAGTNVYAYDLEEHRIIEPSEYEKEMQEVIQRQKGLPWVTVGMEDDCMHWREAVITYAWTCQI